MSEEEEATAEGEAALATANLEEAASAEEAALVAARAEEALVSANVEREAFAEDKQTTTEELEASKKIRDEYEAGSVRWNGKGCTGQIGVRSPYRKATMLSFVPLLVMLATMTDLNDRFDRFFLIAAVVLAAWAAFSLFVSVKLGGDTETLVVRRGFRQVRFPFEEITGFELVKKGEVFHLRVTGQSTAKDLPVSLSRKSAEALFADLESVRVEAKNHAASQAGYRGVRVAGDPSDPSEGHEEMVEEQREPSSKSAD